MKTDFAIATTGNAGPTKGESDAEVGTVYIAIASPLGVFSEKFMMGNHRERIVQKSVNKAFELLQKEILKRNDLSLDDITWLVPHQANMRIIDSVASMLDFPKERVMQTIEMYGNTTAGTLPLCLNDYEDRLKKGDKVLLTAFGGGFTWGTSYLTWAY